MIPDIVIENLSTCLGRIPRMDLFSILERVGLGSYWADGSTTTTAAKRTLRRINSRSRQPLADLSCLIEEIRRTRLSGDMVSAIGNALAAGGLRYNSNAGSLAPTHEVIGRADPSGLEAMAFWGQSEWTLKELIAEGGQAKVYRAWSNEQCVAGALKVLRNYRIRDESALARFERERKVLSTLSHPCILRVLDYGDEPSPFIVSSLATLGTLKGCADVFRRDLWRTLRMGRDIAMGLSAAHKAGLVHRDVKPSNIFLLSLDHSVIGDFGVVLDPSEERLTTTGEQVGTRMFSPPEGSYDATRSFDIFSLGATIHSILRQEEQLSAAEVKASYSVGRYRPLAPQYNDDRFRSIDDMLERMLRIKPEDRIDSCDDVVGMLDQIIQIFFGRGA